MSHRLPFSEAEVEGAIAARFRRVAQLLPNQIAVSAPDKTLTYTALDAASERVAQAIIGRGLPSESGPVAILLEQGASTLVALLGCLKAGRGFVILSPDFPEPKSQAIWQNALSAALLTDSRHWEQAVNLTDPNQCLNLDDLPPVGTVDAPIPSVSPDSLAALFYTTGTTGEPKGVIWSQRLVLHTARQNQTSYQLTPTDRLIVLTSFGFGAAMTMSFAALLSGATLCLHDSRHTSLDDLLRYLQEQEATVLGLPPVGLLRQLLDQVTDLGQLPKLRLVLLGGQPLRRQDVERFWTRLGERVELRYRLAGSETMLMSELVLTPSTYYEGVDVPVGYAPPDKEVFLLDETGHPVGAEETGEITVRSRYLASGYWQQPELTTAAFLPDPHDNAYRIYLTGDMGRFTPQGMLRHLGRKDNIVKIRGYRVQLEAIESEMAALEEVKEAAVIAYPTAFGDKRLTAYFVPVRSPGPDTSYLRQRLAQRLPHYMLPAHFSALEMLPLNATGKVDRAALPPPGKARPDLDTPFIAPRSELERQLADIWAELLELDEVGVDDNFFELGGDSILAMRMVLLVEQRAGGHIPPEFFRAPTVTYLAALSSIDRPSISLDQHPVGRRSFGKRTVKSPHPTTRRIVSHLVNGGPIWGEHCLPYGPGRRMQRLWLRLPLIRQQLLTRAAPLQDWLSILGQDDPDGSKLELSLLANTWRIWRLACILQQDIFERYVTVHNVDRLDAAIASGRPLILVGTHTAGSHSAMRFMIRQRTGKEFWNLGYTTTSAQDAAAKTVYARALLLQGGIVQVTGDGAKGERGVEMSIYGHPWLFRSGGAELALDTNAVMLPVFHSMTLGGHINVEFQEPLTCASLNRTQQVEELTRQYATLLIDHLPTLVSNMRWYKLRQFQAYSITARR